MLHMRNTISQHEGNILSMAKSFLPLIILFLIISPTASYARDISFSWVANDDTVDGYKLYYKTGSTGAPYNGAGATEGISPVTLGKVTTVTLHGLSNTERYYFTITAYEGSVESNYCTEIVVLPGTGSTTIVAPTIISITPQ